MPRLKRRKRTLKSRVKKTIKQASIPGLVKDIRALSKSRAGLTRQLKALRARKLKEIKSNKRETKSQIRRRKLRRKPSRRI